MAWLLEDSSNVKCVVPRTSDLALSNHAVPDLFSLHGISPCIGMLFSQGEDLSVQDEGGLRLPKRDTAIKRET